MHMTVNNVICVFSRYTAATFPFPMNARASSIIGWICVGLVSAFTVFSAVMNMLPLDGNQAGIDIATRLGIIDFIFALGVVKLVLVVLYVLPRTSTVGFVLMVGYFGGALATNMTHGFTLAEYSPIIVTLAVMTVGAYFRNPELLTRLKGRPVAA